MTASDRPPCNVLIVGPLGAQQAWCKPCGWEGPVRSIEEMARLDGQHHTGQRPDTPPPWARGPGAAA